MKTNRRSKLKAWGGLLLGLFLIWTFAFVIGPWFQQKIPIMNEIFTLIEEQEINANAYFYTEIDVLLLNHLDNLVHAGNMMLQPRTDGHTKKPEKNQGGEQYEPAPDFGRRLLFFCCLLIRR